MGISRVEYIFSSDETNYSIHFRHNAYYYGCYTSKDNKLNPSGMIFMTKSSEYQQTATKEVKKWLHERGLEC